MVRIKGRISGPGRRPTHDRPATGQPFVVRVDTALAPAEAWARLTDWPAHGRLVPLTTISAPPASGLGTVFVARTALGPLGFDDPMEIVAWEPPRYCRVEKRGRAVRGWAELTVDALPASGGARVTWREVALPAGLPSFAAGTAAMVARRLFGRVVRGLLADV